MNGDIRKTRANEGSSLDISKLISRIYIRPKLLTSGGYKLNDKQREKNKEKKSKWLCPTTWGQQRRGPQFVPGVDAETQAAINKK